MNSEMTGGDLAKMAFRADVLLISKKISIFQLNTSQVRKRRTFEESISSFLILTSRIRLMYCAFPEEKPFAICDSKVRENLGTCIYGVQSVAESKRLLGETAAPENERRRDSDSAISSHAA
ncbi:MAG: hypothetical protein WCA89_10740 [Terracidiphilus sp.]|jgi:hypothetical protein